MAEANTATFKLLFTATVSSFSTAIRTLVYVGNGISQMKNCALFANRTSKDNNFYHYTAAVLPERGKVATTTVSIAQRNENILLWIKYPFIMKSAKLEQ